MLSVKDLHAAYGERRVLKGISLSVERGQVCALIGPNGAGKSTLIRAISGAVPITGGQVCIDGLDAHQLKPNQRARKAAVVPQARNLPLGFTAWEAVLLGRTPHLNWMGQLSTVDEQRAQEAMRRTDCLQLAGRRLGELSGGEQQRVLLARALAQAAPLLLLDEPTTHLDLQYQISLMELLRDLAGQQYAILVAVHDLNLAARYADRMALLVDGHVQAQGRPVEVLQPAVLSRAYRTPLQVVLEGPGGYPWVGPG